MAYEAKDFSSLLGVKGLSENLLKAHFTLYQGYVANTNKLLDLLDTKEAGTPEYSELQRRFGWEWNGMRLHELYFENLSNESNELPGGKLRAKMEKIYGSLEQWEKNFAGVGMMRGIGWTILFYDELSGELFNVWINEHDAGHLAGAVPLLVMDVFEHAYLADYGIKRADYIEAFFKAIDWLAVEKRFNAKF
ncbi:MAG: Fe-Mn family superoxide dismutase [bacterium]|nr:Fe-Mn family superoxide dismutase [bacterium]